MYGLDAANQTGPSPTGEPAGEQVIEELAEGSQADSLRATN